jgi:transcriptional regulator with XRE-family HTH domain
MSILRELRTALGLRQADVACKIQATISDYCLYETGAKEPILEDMLILEKEFGQQIDWQDPLTPRQRHEIVQALIKLSERYPLSAVLDFARRNLKQGTKLGNPGGLIKYYAESLDEPPLLPGDIK